MNVLRTNRLSPTFVVAVVALFVALGGTAGAVVAQAVPLAKRALIADNAKKVGGQTSAQIISKAAQQGASQALQQSAAGARPASTATGLVVSKSQAAGSVDPGVIRVVQIACDSGQTVVGGGMSSDGAVVTFDSYPLNSTTWEVGFGNLGSGAANVSAYALCLK
jgi:hypothetical protein